MVDTSNPLTTWIICPIVEFRTVVISVQSADAQTIAEPARRLNEFGVDTISYARNSEDIDDDVLEYQELVRQTKQADFVFIRCMSNTDRFKRYDKYSQILGECKGLVFIFSGNPDVTLMYRGLFRGSDEQYKALTTYASSRGPANDYGIFHYVAHCLGMTDAEPPAPVENRRDGYYHKEMDRDISRDDYLKTLDPKKMTVGILFASNLWLYDNLAVIDALTEEVERRGMNALPVFYSAVSFRTEGSLTTKDTIRTYFTDNGKPLVDVVLIYTSFSVMFNAREELAVHRI